MCCIIPCVVYCGLLTDSDTTVAMRITQKPMLSFMEGMAKTRSFNLNSGGGVGVQPTPTPTSAPVAGAGISA